MKSHKRFYIQKLIILIIFITINYIEIIGQEHSNFIHLEPTQNKKSIHASNVTTDNNGYILMSHSYSITKFDGYNYYHTSINDIFKNIEPNDRITGITKDFHNNIWIKTINGMVSICDTLGNYNEFNFLKGKTIHGVFTNKKSIYLGTKNGEIYKYSNNKVEKIITIPNIVNNVSEILSIVESDSNNLFISTDKGNIFQYSLKEKSLTTLYGPFTGYPGNLYITLDLSNKLWIGTETFGLFAYDITKKTFVQDTLYQNPVYNIKNEMFISIFCDSKGFVWAGTDGGGLYRIDSENGTIHLFTHQETNSFSLSSNTVIDIYEDSHENIWVSTNYGALNILPEVNNKIYYYPGSENNTPSRILSIHKSEKGTLWVGTDGTGITKINVNKNGTTNRKQYFKNEGLKKGFYIQSISEDNLANIWFGTYKNGLWYHDTKKDSFKNIPIINSSLQNASDIRYIYKDSKNRIWVASNLSLNVYSSKLKLLASFENETHGLKGVIGESIIEDVNGTIWVGYFKGGLFKFEENLNNLSKSNFTITNYYDNKKYDKDILGVKFMELEHSGSLWLINSHGKLIKFNPRNNKYQSFQNISSLKDLGLSSVLSNDKGNLWMSSSNGIILFNVKDSLTTNYLVTDGLQDNYFFPRSAFKDESGTLYFGGINGLNSFNPKDIAKKESKAELFINSFEILNQPAKNLTPDQITTDIEHLKKITLKPDQSSFSFRFSAIDNVLNPNYHYAYRLLGFNDEWITIKKEQLAYYTNIPSGNYTFEVKAGSQKEIWDIPSKKIDIKIIQPLWNRPLAYIFYFLILSSLIYWMKKWVDLKKKLISEKINFNKEKEMHELKMNFFAKMSHEIQTPLTLILGPIDDMLNRAENNGNLLLKQRLQIISNNVKRLSRIVFELTTIRNKELDKIRLFITKNNLYNDLNNITISFKEQARFKNIDFTSNCPQNLSEGWYDKEKLEHIIYNLLSNAFKFTPKEGNIQLIVLPVNNKNSIKISISDSGPGISKEEMNKLFTLFYQSKTGRQTKGTGIGLALTKELIDLHRGKIEVTSSSTEGTTFTISLPITEDAYLDEEKIQTEQSDKNNKHSNINNPVSEPAQDLKHDKTILIVEDNFELQHFLKDLLEPTYNIILAENGKEGYYYAKSNHPDIILSDIMMPEMDGLEMCKRLQKDNLTKHIPIVFLTAKNSTKSKLLGLKSGAIEFINKPFNTNELILKINSIINSTEHIIANFKKELISNPEIRIDKSNDDIFLENLVTTINSKIENPNFKIEELSDSLNMSYSVLYRKCQALTGESLIDLVSLLRLKKAAIVIAKYGYSISEAAYVSGFNDPKYFSKCFKKHFGKTPNAFKKEALKMGSDKYLKKLKLDSSI